MKKINWLNHFLEFIVVLLGILLAFQLNTCSASKKQNKLINNHTDQIIEETEFNMLNVTQAISFAETNLNNIDSLLRLLHTDGELYKINSLSLQLLNVGGLYIRKNSYKSLIETGDIRFMNNFSEKNKIINLYEYYSWVEGIEKVLLDTYSKSYYPYLLENFDMARGKIQNKEIYFSKKFINSVSSYRFTLDMKLNKYKECSEEISKYLNKD